MLDSKEMLADPSLDNETKDRQDLITDQGIEDHAVDGKIEIDVAELPVQLRVEIGKIEMSLGELSNLKVGDVFKIESEIADKVKIFYNESLCAIGELVDISGSLGVQITQCWISN